MTTNIFRFYDSFLQIVDFVVSRTSDSLAEVMIKALPLLAPLPNAVSIFFISQSTLHYNNVQAFAVAASLECIFFALTEVTLKLWDGVQSDVRYTWPLRVAAGLFGLYFVLVLVLVAVLEVPHSNYAPLAFPVISVVAALTLGCERWHKRNLAVAQRKVKPAQSKIVIVQDEPVEVVPVLTAQDTDTGTLDKRQRARQLYSEGLSYAQIAKEIDAHRNTVSAWLKATNGHKAIA